MEPLESFFHGWVSRIPSSVVGVHSLTTVIIAKGRYVVEFFDAMTRYSQMDATTHDGLDVCVFKQRSSYH